MGEGSENVIVLGGGKTRFFRGLTKLQNGMVDLFGGRFTYNVSDAYAGLGNAAQTAIGSVFRVLGAIFYIGSGNLYYNGVDTGEVATSTLSLNKIAGGALEATEYQAGLPQPSAPTIAAVTPPAPLTGKVDGNVSVKIARVRSATGARSIASPVSNVVTCKAQSVAITFPVASTNGQDYWEIDVCLQGQGGIGNHYFLKEIPESLFTGSTSSAIITVTNDVKTQSTADIGVPNDTLTSDNLGWRAVSNQLESNTVGAGPATGGGTATATVTAAGLTGSPRAVNATITNGDTASVVASALKTALEADAPIAAMFDVIVAGAEIVLRRKIDTTLDTTLNLALSYTAAIGFTDDTTSTDATINTYVTAIGADDSYGTSGYQEITLAAAVGTSTTQTVRFTRAVDGNPRTYVVEWKDADLLGNRFASIRDFPPPAGMFAGVNNDVVFVDGCYGDTVDVIDRTATVTPSIVGNAIAVSDPMAPEAFPPDNYLFTGDAPSAIIDGGQGLHWRFGKNSLGVIRYVGGSPALSYERMWSGIGILNQNQATLGGGGRLYAYTGARGAVRIGVDGEPDVFFAAPVADDMAAWTDREKVVLGYDADYGYVMFAYEHTILCFYEALEIWCAPLKLDSTLFANQEIKSIVTYEGASWLSIGGAQRTITGASNATPIVITTSGNHGYLTGDKVDISDVGGNTAANGNWTVTKLTDTTFSLDTSVGNGAYTSGGKAAAPIKLYSFDTSTGSVGKVVTQWIASQQEYDVVSRVKLALRASAAPTVTVNTYVNGQDTSKFTQTFTAESGFTLPRTLRPNVRNAKAWRIETSWAGGADDGIELITVEGESSGIII
jgi:hypothetical protein